MKIDRLLGIIHLLLQKEKITADGLSQTFEVSKRTILRDVNSLCAAGVPIVTTQGYKGGISLMDGYKLENSFINEKELSHILLGLKALKSIDGYDAIIIFNFLDDHSVIVILKEMIVDNRNDITRLLF